MKKKQIFEGVVDKVEFPNKGIINIDGEKVIVKNVIEGQKVKAVVTKKRKNKIVAHVLELLEKSPEEVDAPCSVFGKCGGCQIQSLPYEKQLNLKVRQVRELLDTLNIDYNFEGIVKSPKEFEYRNKMEYSFGDEYKDGPLALGLHRRASMYDIVNATDCKLVHDDFNKILRTILKHFQEEKIPYYSKKDHTGFLRYLVLRRGEKTNQILVNIVTSSQIEYNFKDFVDKLVNLDLNCELKGIIQTINDELADAVKVNDLKVLYGEPYFYEELLDMKFKISPFSFFQTNTLGAEELYKVVREYVGDTKDKIVFDLYSGTGTITQMLAPVAKKAIGVEIVEGAVEAAKVNANLNGLTNCEFIAGDVLKVLDDLTDLPDVIVLDPPRDGIHPKALNKIINYGVDQLVYVSCKPTSLVRDLEVFMENGYKVEKVRCVDMFPQTGHVECISLITKKN